MSSHRLKRLQVKRSVRKDLDNLPVQIKMEDMRFLKETKPTLHQLKERKIRGAKTLRGRAVMRSSRRAQNARI